MNILMIGAHPDDCELRGSGLARKYVLDGHRVRFLSMTDGSGGHQTMKPEALKTRRRREAQAAAEQAFSVSLKVLFTSRAYLRYTCMQQVRRWRRRPSRS